MPAYIWFVEPIGFETNQVISQMVFPENAREGESCYLFGKKTPSFHNIWECDWSVLHQLEHSADLRLSFNVFRRRGESRISKIREWIFKVRNGQVIYHVAHTKKRRPKVNIERSREVSKT